MPGLTTRNLDLAVKQPTEEKGLGSFIQQKFNETGGIEIEPVRSVHLTGQQHTEKSVRHQYSQRREAKKLRPGMGYPLT